MSNSQQGDSKSQDHFIGELQINSRDQSGKVKIYKENTNSNYYYESTEKDLQKIYFTQQMVCQEFKKYITMPEFQTKTMQIISLYKLEKDTQYFEQFLIKILQMVISHKIIDLENKNQNQADDDEATIQVTDSLVSFKLPKIFENEYNPLKNWIVDNQENFTKSYSKNSTILVNNIIYSTGSVEIYQCLDTKTNQFKVFKQLLKKNDYQYEKKMLKNLQEKQDLNRFLYLENIEFDDEFNIVILEKLECDLKELMQIKFDKFFENKKNNENSKNIKFHLDNLELCKFLRFQIDALIKLEQYGIYLQDNKPENILISKQFIDGKYHYVPLIADFGSIYDKNELGFKDYPSYGTMFYFDNELYQNKKENLKEYEHQEVIQNEIYCIARSLQVCLFPYKQSQNQFINNMEQFTQEIENQHDSQLSEIFQKMVSDDYSLRYKSFQELQIEIEQYELKNNNISQYMKWEGITNELKSLQESKIEQFFHKYYTEYIQKENPDLNKIINLINTLQKHSLYQQCISLILAYQEQNKDKIEKNEQSRLLFQLAYTYNDMGNLDQAVENYEKSLEFKIEEYGEGHINTASIIGNLGNIFTSKGDYENAKKYQLMSLKINEQNYGKNHVETADTLGNLGNLCQCLGDYQQAKQYYEQALQILSDHYGENDINTVPALGNLGIICQSTGDQIQAKEYFLKTLEITKEQVGEGHIETTMCLLSLGNVHYKLGDFKMAKKYYQDCLKIEIDHYGEGHVETSGSLGNLGIAYKELGEFDMAKEYQLQALEIQENHYGKGHLETSNSLGSLGQLYIEVGEIQKGKEYILQCIEIQQENYGENHQNISYHLKDLGRAQLWEKDFKSAKQSLIKCLEIQKNHFGEDHYETSFTYFYLGELYKKLGEENQTKKDQINHYQEGLNYTNKSLQIRKKQYGQDHKYSKECQELIEKLKNNLQNIETERQSCACYIF